MEKSIKGTQTEQNLLKAFAGESQARNRYTYFSSAAKKEGYEQISRAFAETAEQEKEHAKRFFSFLEGGELEITACFPAGKVGTTVANLKAAAGGEHEEWEKVYPMFAKIAREEGFEPVARCFEMVSVAEKYHENRYLGFLKNLEEGTAFKRTQPVVWRCINCGYLVTAIEAPKVCPACVHPQAYFEILVENW
jgi:rubrerythrin